MRTRAHAYLFSISYFGARFKGWAKQKGQPTVEGKLDRVFRFVLGHDDFRFIGSSRTDSGVSCRSGFVQIFLREKAELEAMIPQFNSNLGGEIRLNSVSEVSRDFNLIQSVKQKTYRYFFSDSKSFHPFASPMLTWANGINSLEQMQENAGLFVGEHNFKAFCKVSGNKTDFTREILRAKVFETEAFSTEFSPEKTYCFEVIGTGFLYHQVRKMVSAIWYFSPEEIKKRLENPSDDWNPVPTASASGLVLWETLVEV
ncbi:tRNA pseudouridine(38-40) synthase TruA [Algoriphagus sp.]|uniref:tRNA pseudouridine(38-40) synthase TruA n=1 Tax=Algoriphagus sp. TaxID=1872435 RepID=UPI00271E1814|nr:tRNA pseudouridine(38-40) synthase TruA [Algoriphagus sp.]MDO8965437.1 tRNA pseudouridine(38-40) synthase TruA [Algoriphagus sp.]MDP3201476.1 tRNA pseudouridine(38-40) synthase TruA [Algoriphagus sp.]